MKEEKLYPIFYAEKWWTEDEVDDVFRCFYTCTAALAPDKSVYVGEGIRVYPCGKMP